MSNATNGAGWEVSMAAACAAFSVDLLFHPVDTMVTRMQSPMYTARYKTVNGSFNPAFFLGLYQGFGPTLIAGIPSSIAFFIVYENMKRYFQDSKSQGNFSGCSLVVLYGVSSAAAELVSCAIMNPAEVLKQNAQIQGSYAQARGNASPLIGTMKYFAKHPRNLWAGYSTLVASHLPGTALTFSLYESLKEMFLEKKTDPQNDTMHRIAVGASSAAVAGGISSGLFVPVDVIKTRIRLATGDHARCETQSPQKQYVHGLIRGNNMRNQLGVGPLLVARHIIRKEGVLALFRGFTPTIVASALGSGLYIGCYEACKIYLA